MRARQELFNQRVRLQRSILKKKGKLRPKRALRIPPPISLENKYKRDLQTGVVNVVKQSIDTHLIPNLFAFESLIILKDSVKDEALIDVDLRLSELIRNIFRRIRSETDQRIDEDGIAEEQVAPINEYTKRSFERQLTHMLSVPSFFVTPQDLSGHFHNFIHRNVNLITSLRQTHIDQVEEVVRAGIIRGLHPSEISKQIRERTGVAKSRANLIGRDQVLKFNSQLNQARYQDIGLDRYTWSTVGDEAVRPSHAAKNGLVFSMSDPPADTGNPGEDFQCRCVMVPIFSPNLFQ